MLVNAIVGLISTVVALSTAIILYKTFKIQRELEKPYFIKKQFFISIRDRNDLNQRSLSFVFILRVKTIMEIESYKITVILFRGTDGFLDLIESTRDKPEHIADNFEWGDTFMFNWKDFSRIDNLQRCNRITIRLRIKYVYLGEAREKTLWFSNGDFHEAWWRQNSELRFRIPHKYHIKKAERALRYKK